MYSTTAAATTGIEIRSRARSAAIFREHRYSLLSGVLVLLMMSHIHNGQWTSDFWEHSAAVRELATHPFSPQHPLLSIQAPHAFYTPYTLGVAWLSRLTGLHPVGSLSVAAILNLLMFVAALKWFVSLLLNTRDPAPAFYVLLFTLVLWGSNPWTYSGFLNLNALGYTLPYPSTFATVLTLLSWSTCMLYLRHGDRRWLLALLGLATMVVLSHPLTAIVMYVGIGALLINSRGLRPHSDYAVLAGVCLVPLLAATAWPYFSFVGLVFSQSNVFHEGNRDIYAHVLTRTFPALAGLPLLLLRVKRNHRDWLGLTFGGLVVVYAYGYFSGNWSYGRVMPFIVFVLHVCLADWVAGRERRMIPRTVLAWIAVVLVAAYVVTNNRSGLGRSIPGRSDRYSDMVFLAQHTNQYDVILSDTSTGWRVPSFGGKVVAAHHALAFVPEHELRRRDVRRFFDLQTGRPERLNVIERYGVRFLLLNDTTVPHAREILDSLHVPARVVYARGPLTLVELEGRR